MGRMDDYLNCNNKIRIKFRHHKKYQKYHPSDINVPSPQKRKNEEQYSIKNINFWRYGKSALPAAKKTKRLSMSLQLLICRKSFPGLGNIIKYADV